MIAPYDRRSGRSPRGRKAHAEPAVTGAVSAQDVANRGASKRSRATTRCDSEARSLLLPYVLSKCTEGQSITFESHLLSCDVCFRDLKCLDRTGVLIQELLGSGPRAAAGVREARSAGRLALREAPELGSLLMAASGGRTSIGSRRR